MRLHFTHWPRRVPRALTVPETTLWDNLAISAQRYPSKSAIRFFGRAMSYRELADGAERMAAYLHSVGVRKGDRVILLMQNLPQLVLAHFAILRANAIVVPVNPMNLAQELQHYITDAGVKVAITTADLGLELSKASNELPEAQRLQHMVVTQLSEYLPVPAQREYVPDVWQAWLTMERAPLHLDGGEVVSWAKALSCQLPAPALEVGPDDLSVLPYTSGTTGLPKGCMHTHASIGFNALASAVWGQASSENVTLAVIPMFHITGMVAVMHTSIYSGGTLLLMPRWDRELAGQLISQHKVTNWTNIPTMVIDLFASPNFKGFDLSSLSYIGGGGAAMPQAVAQRLWEAYGLRYQEGYGLTETAAPSHSNPPDNAKQQCLGIPFISTQARVVDPDTLQELAVGEQGEILVAGPQVFSGYWGNAAATQAVFVDMDGVKFFRTGDLGHMDEDGYFFITDRLKRMINASGYKVWPAEVESLMFRHPAIQEACIIASKDVYRGETVKAVVVLRESHKGQVSAEDIIAWCRENMAAYKVPRLVSMVDALPKSGSGKVMWRWLQDKENAGELASSAA